jgi:hypothetical protein
VGIVPTGYGLVPPSVAADEGARNQARAVVMVRMQSIDYLGMSVRVRLELMVVKDGHSALRRVAEAEAYRRSGEDAIFMAASSALEVLYFDLNTVLSDIR